MGNVADDIQTTVDNIQSVVGQKTDDETGDTLYSSTYVVDRHFHTRSETYPFLAASVQLTGGAGAWVQGAKTEIIPTATNDIQTLTVTHSCDVAGNVIVALDDINYTVALTTGDTASVATQLRAFDYTDPLTSDTFVVTGREMMLYSHV